MKKWSPVKSCWVHLHICSHKFVMLILFTDRPRQASKHFNTQTQRQKICGPLLKNCVTCALCCCLSLLCVFVCVFIWGGLGNKTKYHTLRQFLQPGITMQPHVPRWPRLHYLSFGNHGIITLFYFDRWLQVQPFGQVVKCWKYRHTVVAVCYNPITGVWTCRTSHIIFIYFIYIPLKIIFPRLRLIILIINDSDDHFLK